MECLGNLLIGKCPKSWRPPLALMEVFLLLLLEFVWKSVDPLKYLLVSLLRWMQGTFLNHLNTLDMGKFK